MGLNISVQYNGKEIADFDLMHSQYDCLYNLLTMKETKIKSYPYERNCLNLMNI